MDIRHIRVNVSRAATTSMSFDARALLGGDDDQTPSSSHGMTRAGEGDDEGSSGDIAEREGTAAGPRSAFPSVFELDENSPRCAEEEYATADNRIELRPHQQALLHRCLTIERERLPVPGTDGTRFLRSRMGIIGDQTGSGKSFVALALLHAELRNDEPSVRSYGGGKVMSYALRDPGRSVKTNMIVFPHSIARQWASYVQLYTDFRFALLCRHNQVDAFPWDSVRDFDVLLVSNTVYTKTIDELSARRLFLRRVVYDEIDSVNFPSSSTYADAQFYWFITASFKNIVNPLSDELVLRRATAYPVQSFGRYVRRNFATSLFYELFGDMAMMSVMRLLIAKNSDAFVVQSMALPPVHHEHVPCFTPASVRVLDGIVQGDVLECLNAHDQVGAMHRLAGNYRGTEDSVIEMMVHAYERTLASSRSRLACMGAITYVSDKEREHEEERLNATCRDMEKQIACIRDRIRGSGVCNICYDDVSMTLPRSKQVRQLRPRAEDVEYGKERESGLRSFGGDGSSDGSSDERGAVDEVHQQQHSAPFKGTKTIVPCCSNVFCMPCIEKWVGMSSSCPVCKKDLCPESLIIIDETTDQYTGGDSAASDAGARMSDSADSARKRPRLTGEDVRHEQQDMESGGESGADEWSRLSDRNTKLENLRCLLHGFRSRRASVLIFSSHDSVFPEIEAMLRRTQLRSAYLRGNGNTINAIVEKYKRGDLDVLLANTTSYGCGMNLENTTDIVMFHKTNSERERQVIGRGNRMGRRGTLRVWYLLHSNELPPPHHPPHQLLRRALPNA